MTSSDDACRVRALPLDEPSALGGLVTLWCFPDRGRGGGADTVMNGDGADHLFAHPAHAFIAERLATGQVRQAWQLANQYSYMSSQSVWRLMTEALKQLVPHGVRDGVGPLLRGGRAASFETLTERTVPPWFTDEVAGVMSCGGAR